MNFEDIVFIHLPNPGKHDVIIPLKIISEKYVGVTIQHHSNGVTVSFDVKVSEDICLVRTNVNSQDFLTVTTHDGNLTRVKSFHTDELIICREAFNALSSIIASGRTLS